MHAVWRVPIRAGIWFLAIWVALLPVGLAARTSILHPVALAEAANKIGLFRDFYFVAIIMVVASMGNVLYSFTKKAPDWVRGLGIFVCLYYVFVLLWGSTRFVELAHAAIPPTDLYDDLIFVGVAALITLLTEVGIASTE